MISKLGKSLAEDFLLDAGSQRDSFKAYYLSPSQRGTILLEQNKLGTATTNTSGGNTHSAEESCIYSTLDDLASLGSHQKENHTTADFEHTESLNYGSLGFEDYRDGKLNDTIDVMFDRTFECLDSISKVVQNFLMGVPIIMEHMRMARSVPSGKSSCQTISADTLEIY